MSYPDSNSGDHCSNYSKPPGKTEIENVGGKWTAKYVDGAVAYSAGLCDSVADALRSLAYLLTSAGFSETRIQSILALAEYQIKQEPQTESFADDEGDANDAARYSLSPWITETNPVSKNDWFRYNYLMNVTGRKCEICNVGERFPDTNAESRIARRPDRNAIGKWLCVRCVGAESRAAQERLDAARAQLGQGGAEWVPEICEADRIWLFGMYVIWEKPEGVQPC